MRVYLDNAATTPIDPEVFESMKPWLTQGFGNPSSTHSFGREAKAALESSRKKIAELLSVTPGEIFFTSGGTEADNTILRGAILAGYKNVISSPIEHHAVLHTLEDEVIRGRAQLKLLNVNKQGLFSLSELEEFLIQNPSPLVSLMHVNNEIGNISDIETIGQMVSDHGGYLHSDTVQAMGHFNYDFSKIKVDGAVCSAHKIHGPKGIGFMFLRKEKRIRSFITGGGQERNMRGGTENIASIVGLAKALELTHERMKNDETRLIHLRSLMIEGLKKINPDITFNGRSAEDGLPKVLNVCFPPSPENEFLLFNLDIKGIAASGGSACNSGSEKGSHVLASLQIPDDHTGIRFSFSRYNTVEEVNYTLQCIREILD